MRLLILILLLIVSFSSFSQDTAKYFYTSGKLRGWQVRVDSNLIFEKSFYENGKLQGEILAFVVNGEPVIKSMKSFYESGEPMDFRNDTIEIRYEPDGSIFQTTQYKDLKKHGKSRTYLAKKLWMEVDFVNDVKEGWLISYDSTGTKISYKAFYRNNKQEGPTKHYNEKGILTKAVYYKDECIDKVEYFDSKGKLVKTITDKKEILFAEGKPLDCDL